MIYTNWYDEALHGDITSDLILFSIILKQLSLIQNMGSVIVADYRYTDFFIQLGLK